MTLGSLLLVACAAAPTSPRAHAPHQRPPAAPQAALREGPPLGPTDAHAAIATAVAQATAGPLEVAFASPRGELAGPSEISLVFSKPMRPLGLPAKEPAPTVLLSPALAGSWQWLGASALRFNVPGELPPARQICAEVPAGTRALDGSPLVQAFRWCFETARPALVGSEPRAGADAVAPSTPVVLAFNQPVSAAELEKRLRVVAVPLSPTGVTRGAGTAVGWTVREADGDRFEIGAPTGWPRASEIRLRIDAGLRPTLGDLPMGRPAELAFRTIRPFTVEGVRCAPAAHDPTACDPEEPTVVIETTTAVGEQELLDALRIEPPAGDEAPTLSASAPDDAEPETDWYEHPRYFRLSASFEPGKRYRILIGGRASDRGLRDHHGQPLATPSARSLRMADLPPELRFHASGQYWPRADAKKLPMSRVNLADATVRALPLELAEVLGISVGVEPLDRAARARASLAPGRRNEIAVTVVDIARLLEEPEPLGPVRILADTERGAGQSRETERVDFQLTDLGLLTRADREQALVWVTSLGQGTPLANVAVAIYGVVPGQSPPTKPIATATTDGRGIAIAPIRLPSLPEAIAAAAAWSPDAPRLLVVARSGRDWAHQSVPVAREAAPVGDLFTERGIYRPGEEIALKGIVRLPRRGALEVPAGRLVRARIEGSERRVVASWTGPVSRFGTFSWRARLPGDIAHGVYRAIAEVAGSELSERLYVVDYRPAESKAAAALDRRSYVRGDQARCTAEGEMLFGAPMAHARATFVVEQRASSHFVPGLHQWTVDDEAGPDRSRGATRVAQSVMRLDKNGRATLPLSLTSADQSTAELVTCSIELEDHNRQSRSAEASAVVHPADAYAAVRRSYDNWPVAGERFAPEVRVVTHQGEPLTRPVRVEVLHRPSPAGGTSGDRPLATCELTSGSAPVSCPVTLPAGPIGDDDTVVVAATTRDGAGNTARASTTIPIVRGRPRPEPSPPPRSSEPRPLPLHVTLDGVERAWNHTYRPGEHARVRLWSPYPEPALAIVTLERETILWHRVVELPARSHAQPHSSALLDIALSSAMVPNAMLRVTAISGAEHEEERLTLRLAPSERVLDLTLHACAAATTAHPAPAMARTPGAQAAPSPASGGCGSRERFEPGDELDVQLAVRDASGAPVAAEVTLWAADEGSLSLIYYRTPQPWLRLFEEREPLVVAADARDDIVRTWLVGHRVKPPQVRMGATSVSGPERSDFRQTVLFEPSLLTDDAGRLVHRVRLPDALTSYRFMAVATTTDDRTGSTELHVTTSKALMLRPTLPRVVRVGDELEASAVIATDGLGEPAVQVDLRAEGLVPVGPTRRLVTVGRDAPEEVRFRVRAERAGPLALGFEATAFDASKRSLGGDRVVLRGHVVAPTLIETVTIEGETRGAVAERLAALELVRADVGGLEVTLEASPLAQLGEGMDQLLEYPYGCTEQLVSRLVPLVTLADLAKALGAVAPTGPRNASATVAEILDAQRSDGGFGFWPGSARSSPWLSTYALWGLDEAARRAVPVPVEALDRARSYVERQLAAALPSAPSAASGAASEASLAEAAFALDVLALSEHPDAARAARLAERQAELPLFAKALLLHALARSGPVGRDTPLWREVEASVRLDGPVARAVARASAGGVDRRGSRSEPLSHLLESDLRTSAMVLRALAAVDPQHRLLAPLARGLLADRRQGRWRTTQEAAWALLALDATRAAMAAPPSALEARVYLGTKRLTRALFEPTDPTRRSTTRLPMAELLAAPGAPLIFEALGGGTLHYQARLRYARRALPEAADAGLFLTKTIRPLRDAGGPAGPPLGGRSIALRAGDVALCELELVSPAPRFAVVIDDPLPGGLEAIELSRREGGAWLAALESSPATRRELRDDRVIHFVDELAPGVTRFRYLVRATTPGRFVAPPTVAEEMYSPETFSRTAPGWVTVAAPCPGRAPCVAPP